jgi:hypothetical protein
MHCAPVLAERRRNASAAMITLSGAFPYCNYRFLQLVNTIENTSKIKRAIPIKVPCRVGKSGPDLLQSYEAD